MNEIHTMPLPQRVRCLPNILLGARGAEGALNAIRLLLELFETEAALGHCDQLSVTLQDNNELVIRCNDRGLCLDNTLVDGFPAWEYAFCRLDPGPRQETPPYLLHLGAIHNTLYGVLDSASPVLPVSDDHRANLCCVQCASEFLCAQSVRGRIRCTVDFQRGYRVSGPTQEHTDEEQGTQLRFVLDPEVFGRFEFPLEALRNDLNTRSPDRGSLRYTVIDARI